MTQPSSKHNLKMQSRLLCDLNLSSLFQETDFVCFDTGFNRFNNYDIDSLLASSPEANDSENERTPAQSQKVDEIQPSADEEATDSETQTEHRDDFEDLVPENQSASTLESNSDVELESPYALEVEPESADAPDASESPEEKTEMEQTSSIESAFNGVTSERNETKDRREKSVGETLGEMNVSEIEPAVSEDESVIFENETGHKENKTDILENEPISSSEHAQIPESETTLGTTFDAVATDDEITKSVTPYEEEESENVRHPSENEIDDVVGTPLLHFSEEAVTTPIYESPQTKNDDKQESAEEKNMWTSIGDAVFSVVTGGERAESDASLEEDDEDEDEEEEKSSYGAKKEVDNPARAELEEEPENAEQVLQDPLSSSVPHDDKEPDTDSEKLFFDSADDKEVTEHEEETIKPTETSTILVDPISGFSAAQQTDLRVAEEPVQPEEKEEVKEEEEEEKEPIDSELNIDDTPIQDSSVAIDHWEDLDSELTENKLVTDGDLASSGTRVEQSTEEAQLGNLGVKEDEKMVEERIPDLVYDHSVTDLENNSRQPEFSVEEPVTHVELPQDELEVDKDALIEEEEKEELLEDENALSLTQSNDTDSEEPDTALPNESTPELVYSDSVLRLTLLREHFTEEKMEQVQKLLGLKNLFKVEAMFSDLDTELQATRHSQTGGTQDIENALEGILEASENTILDEIEKMLDSQSPKRAYDQQTDAGGLDEETEILDDFQELAFSLRQKYSTASDSAPLTTEPTGISPGGFVMILRCASGLFWMCSVILGSQNF